MLDASCLGEGASPGAATPRAECRCTSTNVPASMPNFGQPRAWNARRSARRQHRWCAAAPVASSGFVTRRVGAPTTPSHGVADRHRFTVRVWSEGIASAVKQEPPRSGRGGSCPASGTGKGVTSALAPRRLNRRVPHAQTPLSPGVSEAPLPATRGPRWPIGRRGKATVVRAPKGWLARRSSDTQVEGMCTSTKVLPSIPESQIATPRCWVTRCRSLQAARRKASRTRRAPPSTRLAGRGTTPRQCAELLTVPRGGRAQCPFRWEIGRLRSAAACGWRCAPAPMDGRSGLVWWIRVRSEPDRRPERWDQSTIGTWFQPT